VILFVVSVTGRRATINEEGDTGLRVGTPFFILEVIYDGLVKSLKRLLSVIPAQAGIQCF
jgi:hypothetical protein